MKLVLKDLLQADDHRDPYVWGAVFLAHAFIGVAGWIGLGMGVVAAYIVFEFAQALFTGKADVADSAFDTLGVAGGALVAQSLNANVTGDTWAALGLVAFTCALGMTVKVRQWRYK